MFPRLSPLYEGLMSNRYKWNLLAQSNMLDSSVPLDDPPLVISSSVVSSKTSGDKIHKSPNKGHNAKRISKSPKAHRSPMAMRKSPAVSRRQSDPQVSSRLTRNTNMACAASKCVSSTKDKHVIAGRSSHSPYANGRTQAKGGLSTLVGNIFSLFLHSAFYVFLDASLSSQIYAILYTAQIFQYLFFFN